MYQRYKDIIVGSEIVEDKIQRAVRDRDLLIESFNESLGNLRLSMRLRKRSGGLLAWRNIAIRGKAQRDFDLVQYRSDIARLPQSIRLKLLDFEKRRIVINLNLSLLQHEKRQLQQAIKKIEYNTSLLESMCA